MTPGERIIAALDPLLRWSPASPSPAEPAQLIFRPSPRWLMLLRVRLWGGLLLAYIFATWGAYFFLWLCGHFAPLALLVYWNLWLPQWVPTDYIFAVSPLVLGLASYSILHVRYEFTRYTLSADALRIHSGVFIGHETTLTCAAIQNVAIRQGPIQRLLGISAVIVQTAGGKAGSSDATPGRRNNPCRHGHTGHLEGIENATEIREAILERASITRSAPARGAPISRVHIDALRAVRDEARALAARPAPT